MRIKKWVAISSVTALLVVSGGALALGDYVYTSGTTVPCAINEDDKKHTPAEFYTGGKGNGPFPGDGWDKWVGHDLSSWWLTDVDYEAVTIPVDENVELSAWWIAPYLSESKRTVIVTHGIGTSRRDYTSLLSTAMLVRGGFNVLLVDQRDTGESTCTDGRHSAGQEESSDFAVVAQWLVDQQQIPSSAIGMFGISGGAVLTGFLPAKTENVAAFAMEGSIFDFNSAATQEVEYQGFPGFLWQLALAAAQILHGVNLSETSAQQGIEAAGDRPILILHGDADQRLKYQSSVDFYNYGKSVGANVRLETFEGADHTEGMLSETDRYAKLLTEFFDQALSE